MKNTDAQTPAGTRRQQQKAQTRKLILDAARSLFEDRGFEGTTMRQLAAKAGVGVGTIFTHFPDKGALLIAALLDDLAKVDQQILETLPSEAPIKDQITHLARAGYGYWCDRPALSATLLREMWFITGPWSERRRAETARFIEFVLSLLDDARQRGEIRSDVDLRNTAEALYSFYLGSLIRAAADDRFDRDALVDETTRFFDQLLTGVADTA